MKIFSAVSVSSMDSYFIWKISSNNDRATDFQKLPTVNLGVFETFLLIFSPWFRYYYVAIQEGQVQFSNSLKPQILPF